MDFSILTTVEAALRDHVLTVTLNRPHKLNAFNQAMLDDFKKLWAYADINDDVHVVVLRAAGDRAFSTGVDVVEEYDTVDNPFSRRDPAHWLCPKLAGCWKPVVCAVHGMVAGGAFYWLNEADIIIAADDVEFFDPHVSFGLVAALEPIGLTRRIPLGDVLRMALLGLDERISGQEALQMRLISELLPRDELWSRAQTLAERIAAKPPVAVQGTVRAIWESLDTTRTHALSRGMSYVVMGNEIASAQVDRSKVSGRDYELR
ncbi:enoyl-CoA hydratase/isomerase family protein [Nocardia gamkensis]|uniref:enoyl-CoA hydratase/isomerase family protein n=1 Tax=Nocardia gamkensis TaxID=352869 RepID=UPI0036EA6DAD